LAAGGQSLDEYRMEEAGSLVEALPAGDRVSDSATRAAVAKNLLPPQVRLVAKKTHFRQERSVDPRGQLVFNSSESGQAQRGSLGKRSKNSRA
jgi:hypothetical protein